MTDMNSNFKSMGLYRNVDRIMADLEAMGKGGDQPLAVADLTSFDQYHYEGTDAVDDAIEFLRPDGGSHILDLGSGLGGPARYLAEQSGAKVTALEIQADLNETAAALTERCRMSELVAHLNGDMLNGVAGTNRFDGIVSMLCVLHIADRATLFTSCAQALKPGGRIFIDDYVALAPLTEAERTSLADKVYCPYVPNLDTYVSDVTGAGFVDVKTEDKTADWKAFVTDRLAAFHAARLTLVDRYGEATVDGLDDFYSTVANLFTGGHLGGLRLTATLAE